MNDVAQKLLKNEHMLLWFDLETTGLDERKEVILEVGWGITDLALTWIMDPMSYLIDAPVIVEPGGAMVYPDNIHGSKHNIDRYVYKMHLESGLWADLATNRRMSLRETEKTILSVMDIAPRAKYTMAGSGVAAFDMRWINYHMPNLHERLTYYTIDTGCHDRVETLCRTGEIRGASKSSKHRAVDDILKSHERLFDHRQQVLCGIYR